MNRIDNSKTSNFYACDLLQGIANKVRKGYKWKTICPKCKSEVLGNCIGCITGKMLLCNHQGTNIKTKDDGIPDEFNNISWEELK